MLNEVNSEIRSERRAETLSDSPGPQSSPARSTHDAVSPAPAAVSHFKPGSQFLSVSVRAWLATLILGTICALCVMSVEPPAPLWTLAGAVVTYFFTQSSKPSTASTEATK